jgi:hypothetical protein
MNEVSAEEATLLVSAGFDFFEGLFDKNQQGYREIINYWAFNATNYIECRYDEDPFYQTALRALFTYEIDGKAVSLLDTMSDKDREAFIARLEKKMQSEYDLWKSGFRASTEMPTEVY